ncbi:hypothetical protein [Agrobacterium larrymoorei]|uniref:Succinoglycan biosynthesis protein exop n=1 Tax=Agrobacterium larrymoorei TaxID=160699 RepID=A0AAF0H5M2_9HYPH|nr:hypothetical protein [Agrobacterium larrymoorei]WHA40789.1 hypothetical protein CFBP5477_013370 [Agrobacterium larrymoorei]
MRNRLVIPAIEGLRGKLRPAMFKRHLLSAACIVSFVAAGAFLPGIVFPPNAETYQSHAVVKVAALNGNIIETRRLAATMQQNLLSPVALTLTVSDLKLKAGDVTGADDQGRIGVLLDMVLGTQEPEIPASAIEAALQNSVTIASSSNDEIDITASAASPEAAQKIVDYLSRRVARDVGGDHSEPELRAVESARKALDAAEAALTGFQMRHGNDAVSRMQTLQQKMHEADINLSALAQSEHDLSQAVNTASAMKADDVLTKTLPPLPAFVSLEQVRESYGTAKLALAEVSIDHGPKHPRTIAAQAAVDAARAAAMPAMRRALESVKADLKTVAASLNEQTEEKSALEHQLGEMGTAPDELAKLEKGLDKARRDYLVASEKAGPFAAPRISAAVSKPALPGVAQKDGTTSAMMALGGGLAGLLMALFVLSFRREESEQSSEVEPLEPEAVEADPVVASQNVEFVEMEPDIFHDLVEPDAEPVLAEEPETASADAPMQDLADLEAANDIPLDERVRQVLMSNRVAEEDVAKKEDGFRLPPLLAAALEGKAEHPQAETEEVKALRQGLARLKARLDDFTEEKINHRRG